MATNLRRLAKRLREWAKVIKAAGAVLAVLAGGVLWAETHFTHRSELDKELVAIKGQLTFQVNELKTLNLRLALDKVVGDLFIMENKLREQNRGATEFEWSRLQWLSRRQKQLEADLQKYRTQ